MPTYIYHARDLQGVDHKGTIETADERQVTRIIGKKGLIVISIKLKDQNRTKIFDKFVNKVSFDELVIATRQLATMIESGLVLSEALDILADQQANKNFKDILLEVSRDLKGGIELAVALKKHPRVFPAIYVSLVKAGEESGKLDAVLTQLANTLEKDRDFRSKVRGAMIYPVLVIGMMFVVMLVMMIFVIPRLTSLYTQSSIELPLPTKILIGTSSFLINFWWLLILVITGAIFAFRRWIATPEGRFKFDEIVLKTPIVGKIVKATTMTNFTRTFGLLITAGIPLLDALTIVANVIGNSVYKRALENTFKGVERGLTFSKQLEAVGVFPTIIYQMFRVGEETGKIDKVAFKMSEYFESESDQMLKNITIIIEPVILIVLGVGVTFLVLSIILPIYKLTTSIS
jgi:type II secretory pathway component PulF